ncbi:MBL fold metallo-hydrolase [candidate division WOR-3 bacterium]|nr:MBL fold metallo-hydrolase [candidate division WOR-3 bacterium]
MKAGFATLLLALVLTGCARGNPAKEEKVKQLEIEEVPLDQLCITVVYDNTAYFSELRSDWGFACVIDAGGKKILFDTGSKGEILLANFDGIGLDPGKIEMIALSHEHWDHVGGLEGFLARNSNVVVYVLKSFPNQVKKMARDAGAGLHEVSDPEELCTGIYTTGTMGRAIEEQSLIITTDKGAMVITGCAHPGIVEIVKKAKQLTGQEILAVMGGFHLGGASEREVKEIIEEFKQMGVSYVGPCHCTGEAQIELFREAYEHRCLEAGVGREITGIDFMQ